MCFSAAATQGHSEFVGISSESTLTCGGVSKRDMARPTLLAAADPGAPVPLQQPQRTQKTHSPRGPLHTTFLHHMGYLMECLIQIPPSYSHTGSRYQSPLAQVALKQKNLIAIIFIDGVWRVYNFKAQTGLKLYCFLFLSSVFRWYLRKNIYKPDWFIFMVLYLPVSFYTFFDAQKF